MTLQTADPGDRSTTPSLPGAPGDRPGSLLRQSISSSAPICRSITWVGTRSHTIPSTRPHSPIPYSPSSTPGSSTPWKPTWPSPARSYSGARRAQHGHMSVWIGERCVITGDVLHHPIQCRHSECTARGDADPDVARATRRALLAAAATTNALMLGTHFTGTAAGRILSTDQGYHFAPQPHD